MFMRSFLALLALVAISCQGKKEQPEQAVTRDRSIPQMKRIEIQGPEEADQLLAEGVDLVVIEDDYVIASVPADVLVSLSSANQISDATEKDLVQRLIEIRGWQQEDLTRFAEMGLDIWEVSDNVVLAQAYDKYIRQLQSEGYAVNIKERDARNVVKK